jgi:Ca-activated chloride channel family protein
MTFLWPSFIWLLGLLPLIIGGYIWILRRRRRFVVRYSSLSLVRAALPRHTWWRRHLPFALLVLALTSLLVALARPAAIVSMPAGQATIILALDVSRSMCSTDIEPNRLVAAQDAAISFIREQPANTQIGIVAFAGFAESLLPPTNDQELLEDVVLSLTTGRRTAIGSAILEAINMIADLDPNVAPSVYGSTSNSQATPVPQGVYAPSIVVLLTDGAANAGPLPIDAAQQAADRGVRVYTIGYGTDRGGMMNCLARYGDSGLGGSPWGGDQFFGGGGFRRGIDEETLKQVAEITSAEYYSAESAAELQEVFANLPTSLIMRYETSEISVAFTALGALLATCAIALSTRWQPLP